MLRPANHKSPALRNRPRHSFQIHHHLSGDKHHSQMRKIYKWLLKHTKKAEQVISSTVEEIPATKKRKKTKKDGSRKTGKRKKK